MTSVLLGYEISKTVIFFRYEISKTVGFVLLWDFNDGQFCSVTRFQWQLVLFLCFFNDGRFCSVMRSQWRLVLFLCSFSRFQRHSVLFRYEILMMVGFVRLRDLNDGWFSESVGFVLSYDFKHGRVCSVTRSQWWLVLFLCSFNDGRFCSVMSFQWHLASVLLGYKISKRVGFVSLRDFNDGWFCFFVLLRDFKDSRFCFIMRF